MDCHEAQRLMIIGEEEIPDSAVRERVRNHMAQCNACTLFYRSVKNTMSLVHSAYNNTVDDEPMPGYLDEVQRRIENRKRERRFQRYIFAGAAVILLAAASLFGIQSPFDHAPQTKTVDVSDVMPMDSYEMQLAEEYIYGADLTEIVDAYGIQDDTSIIEALIEHSYQSLKIEDFLEFLDNENFHMALASN